MIIFFDLKYGEIATNGIFDNDMDYKNGKPLVCSAIIHRSDAKWKGGDINIGMTFEELQKTWMPKCRRLRRKDEK